jgi:hypothetical protein
VRAKKLIEEVYPAGTSGHHSGDSLEDCEKEKEM